MKKLMFVVLIAISTVLPSYIFAEDSSDMAEDVVLYVDINVDDAEKMSDLLKGVGAKKAQAIVEYREQFGPFQSIDDLLNVSGIGPATLEKNRAAIRVGVAN